MNKHIGAILLAGLVMVGAGCAGKGQAPVVSPEPNDTTPAAVTASVRLDLSGQALTELPKYVLNRTDLRELDISDNQLTGALPAEIRLLAALEVLDASDNAMTGLPAEIGQSRNLRILDLSGNKLTGLPMELGNLTHLETLDLRGNLYAKQDLDAIRKTLPNTTILVD